MERGGTFGQAMPAKRIILLLDGTWNDAAFGSTDTNIVRLREIIARSLDEASLGEKRPDFDGTDAGGKSVTARPFGDKMNVVFYERGGAFLNRWVGGAFGSGIASNIRRAYKFLSFYYEPGDQVFIFGFSRGAYTARSLVGYINAAGLLRRETCTPDREDEAWDLYRCTPGDRHPGIWESLTPYVHDREKLRLACLGVFDTVGALGVPLAPFRVANRDKYEFHSVELSSITDVNLQALAIDEQREPFEATVWRKSRFKLLNTETEQVWFSGAHADIGGGYVEEPARAERFAQSLDDITLDWMLKRVRKHFADFPITPKAWPALADPDASKWAAAPQHQPRRGIYRLIMPRAFRSIGNYPVPSRRIPFLKGLSEINVSYDRHASTIKEMVHISVLERLGKKVPIERKTILYSPKNLCAVLGRIAQTYSAGQRAEPIYVVDWTGEIFNPAKDDHCRFVTGKIAEAKMRLTATG